MRPLSVYAQMLLAQKGGGWWGSAGLVFQERLSLEAVRGPPPRNRLHVTEADLGEQHAGIRC